MSATSGARGARRFLAIAVFGAVTSICLAACSSNSSSTGTTAKPGSGTSTTSGSPSGTSSSTTVKAQQSAAARLAALAQSVQSAKGGTFKLGYSESSSVAGGSHSLVFEQMPPKFLIDLTGSDAGLVVDTGSGTYTCSNLSGHQECYSFGTTNPLAPFIALFTGGTVETAFRGLESGIAAKEAGVSATFSTQTFAGQASECVSGVKGSDTFKYCVTGSGVLAYSGGSSTQGSGAITLTSYSTNVSSSDFALPAGAKVVTIPTTSTTG